MESDKPNPTVKQETVGECQTPNRPYRRGLTPRNLTPEQRSRNIQVECQKKNNIERELHHSWNTGHCIDVDAIEYADDEVHMQT